MYIYIFKRFNHEKKKDSKTSSVFLHWIEGNFTNVCVRLSEYEGSSIKSASGKSFSWGSRGVWMIFKVKSRVRFDIYIFFLDACWITITVPSTSQPDFPRTAFPATVVWPAYTMACALESFTRSVPSLCCAYVNCALLTGHQILWHLTVCGLLLPWSWIQRRVIYPSLAKPLKKSSTNSTPPQITGKVSAAAPSQF